MMPVEETATSSSLIPRDWAVSSEQRRASCRPASPVQALALPLLISTAWHNPLRMRGAETISGAACTRLVVKTAAQRAGTSEKIKARSGFPEDLTADERAANLNPLILLNTFSISALPHIQDEAKISPTFPVISRSTSCISCRCRKDRGRCAPPSPRRG